MATQPKVWTMREHTSLEDLVNFEAIGVKLLLADIYAKVSLPVESQEDSASSQAPGFSRVLLT